ncbi:Uncharacterised protein [Mycobacteroides abscessus subsp. massiliense]|nr:Uncharacterised protein [Mycobacteroides abscessus subsp. massiliense]
MAAPPKYPIPNAAANASSLFASKPPTPLSSPRMGPACNAKVSSWLMTTTTAVRPIVALGLARMAATAPLYSADRSSGRSGMMPGFSAGGAGVTQ